MSDKYILTNRYLTLITDVRGQEVVDYDRRDEVAADSTFIITRQRLEQLQLTVQNGVLAATNNVSRFRPIITATFSQRLAKDAYLEVQVSLTEETELRYVPENMKDILLYRFYDTVIKEHVKRENIPDINYANKIDTVCDKVRLYTKKPANIQVYEVPLRKLQYIQPVYLDKDYQYITYVNRNPKDLFATSRENGTIWHDAGEHPTRLQCNKNNNRFFAWDGMNTYMTRYDSYDKAFRTPVDHGGIMNNEIDKKLLKWTELPAPPTI